MADTTDPPEGVISHTRGMQTNGAASRIDIVSVPEVDREIDMVKGDCIETPSAMDLNENMETQKSEMEDADESALLKSRPFEVDVTQIKSVAVDEQAFEIQSLGLAVYDQVTLEKGIWDQVEEESRRREVQEQLAAVSAKLKHSEQQLQRKHPESLSKLPAKSLLRDALIQSKDKSVAPKLIGKQKEEERKELLALRSKKAALQAKLFKSLQGKEQCTERGSETETETEIERKIRMGEMTPFGTALDGDTSNLSGVEKYLKSQQELQKKMLNSVARKRKLSSVKSSPLKRFEKDKTKGKDIPNTLCTDTCESVKKTKSVLKMSVLMPKKRRKEGSLGTEISTLEEDQDQQPGHVPGEQANVDFENSGSEYVPSESDFDNSGDEVASRSELGEKFEGKRKSKHIPGKTKKQEQCHMKKHKGKSEEERWAGGSLKRRKRKHKPVPHSDPEDWASDDSDWICTDDEISSDGDGGARKKKRTLKREVDDGNDEDFFRRVKLWERKNEGIREQMTEECHKFDNGYKIPQLVWDKLYKYQQVGVQWLWELHLQRCGGILGDEMGLGKTVQIISFLAGLTISDLKCRTTGYRGLGPTLIVCPTTVMHQWVREFHSWFPPIRVAILHDSGCFVGKRTQLIRNIVSARGVLITSYTAVVRLKDSLLNQRWHYVVLDEGHKIRNPDAQVTLVVKQLRTPHRIILSGSPMQNHLRELWSLMDFVFPGKLGTLPVFMQEFAIPITQGGYANASEVMVATAFKCATILRDSIAPYLLRRMKSDVGEHIQLPPKSEQVLFCRLTEEQRDLYRGYLDCSEVGRILDGRLQIFVGLINLRKICNHPHLYSGGPKIFKGESEEDLPIEERFGFWKKAGKMVVIEALLKIWHRQQHRVLIFTQTRQMLLILENFIQQQGYSYLKLDGSTSISARQPLINKFNQDTSYFIMLLSTKVGGLGVNLTGADRVVIYDPDWNPATDTQARERAWRIGQQNAVTVYRLITAGTIEEKMYHRQIFKQFLCNKVLKDPRQRRFFKSNDLVELFTLKEADDGSTETSAIFAGTGSQVQVPRRSYKDRHSQDGGAEDRSSKRQGRGKLPETDGGSKKASNKIADTKISFSKDKLENMKRLAQELSKKISNKLPGSVSLTDGGQKCDGITKGGSEPGIDFKGKTKELGTDPQTNSSCSSVNLDMIRSETEVTKDAQGIENFKDIPLLDSDDDLEQMKKIAEELNKELVDKVRVAAAVNKQQILLGDNCNLSTTVTKEAVPGISGINAAKSASLNEDCISSCDKLMKETKDSSSISDAERIDLCLQLDTGRDSITRKPKKDHSLSGAQSSCHSKMDTNTHRNFHKKHKKHKKHRKKRDIEFEGEKVSHLVKSSSLQTKTSEEMKGEDSLSAKHDDYVLRKLFAKTGLHTALQHDKIMEGGHADYALVEGEARRVAQEAVKALKKSRRQCWSALSGVPTWTGSSGAVRQEPAQRPSGGNETQPKRPKPKFGTKKKHLASNQKDKVRESQGGGSSGLLARIHARNLLLTADDDDDNNAAGCSGPVEVPDSNKDLLDDVRTFVSFGASVDGRATTEEIVSHFRDRLPPESSALFKQMLMQICEFHRLPSGLGVWKLIQDFQW